MRIMLDIVLWCMDNINKFFLMKKMSDVVIRKNLVGKFKNYIIYKWYI